MDGGMGMTNREEQEVRRGAKRTRKKKKLPSFLRQKLASESIMSDERGTGCTTCDDIISDSPTLPERPKVDNMFRSSLILSPSSQLPV